VVTVHRDVARTLSFSGSISGLAAMNNELYVGREDQSVIEVYDIATLSLRRNLSIPGLGCVYDMTSCPQCDVVYISDMCGQKIIAINEYGVVVSSWSVAGAPFGLSVNSQLNVVVAIVDDQVQVFTRQGKFLRKIYLRSNVVDVHLVIQLEDDRYVTAHGTGHQDRHRVRIVNGNGAIIHSYGGSQRSGLGQLNGPYRMLIFGGSLIVANHWNSRVLLFSVSSLQYVRELISTRDTLFKPYHLAISDDGTRLFVSYGRELRTFNVTWI
jgi:hypothetical protein